MSIGFFILEALGIPTFSISCSDGEKSFSITSFVSLSSVAITHGPHAFVIIAILSGISFQTVLENDSAHKKKSSSHGVVCIQASLKAVSSTLFSQDRAQV
jgi:hypothetical protein